MFIKTPAESSKQLLDYIEIVKSEPGLSFGTPQLDKHILPARLDEVTAIIGLPGHGKTSYLSFLAINEAREINKRGTGTIGKSSGEAVLYITWEQNIATQEATLQVNGQYNLEDIHQGVVSQKSAIEAQKKRLRLPLWLAGYDLQDKYSKPMYIDALISEILDTQEKFKIRFRGIFLDYFQLIPTHRNKNRLEQIGQAILDSKDLARQTACPVFLGVQSKMDVLKRNDQVPGMGDVYFSSELDHVLDKGLGIFKPSQRYQIGKTIPWLHQGIEHQVPVTKNLFVINLFKQRKKEAGKRFLLHFDINTMTLGDVQL